MEIVWGEVALRSFERLHGYIAEDNPTAVAEVYERILRAVRNLSKLPGVGRLGRINDTRELVVAGTSYIVVYTVIDNRVHIIAVQHGAQEWPERF